MRRTFGKGTGIGALKTLTQFVVAAVDDKGVVNYIRDKVDLETGLVVRDAQGVTVKESAYKEVSDISPSGLASALHMTYVTVSTASKIGGNIQIVVPDGVETILNMVNKIRLLGGDPAEVFAKLASDAEDILDAGYSTKFDSAKRITGMKYRPREMADRVTETWLKLKGAEKTVSQLEQETPSDLFANDAA